MTNLSYVFVTFEQLRGTVRQKLVAIRLVLTVKHSFLKTYLEFNATECVKGGVTCL